MYIVSVVCPTCTMSTGCWACGGNWVGTELTLVLIFIQSPSLPLGSRVRIVFGYHAVVADELRPVLHLELPAGPHRVTLFDAAQDRRLVAPCTADSDKHLLRNQRLAVLGLVRQENSRAVRVVGDGRLRQR